MAGKTKKNITIHPVNDGIVDQDTDLFPKTLIGNIYENDGETPYDPSGVKISVEGTTLVITTK